MSKYIDSLLLHHHSICILLWPHLSHLLTKTAITALPIRSLYQKTLFRSSDELLNVAEMPLLTDMLVERKVKRRQCILQEEQVCRHYFLVSSGCLRLFQIDKKGFEHNLYFAAENEWITDLDSFYNNSPSKVYIEAIEYCTILQVKKEDLLDLFSQSPETERVFRIIAESRTLELQERMFQMVSSSAEERYTAFVSKFPRLKARLPSKEIASLLGITPEFLSRVRRDLIMK